MNIKNSEYFSDKDTVIDLREERDPNEPSFKIKPSKSKFEKQQNTNISLQRRESS